MAIYKHGTYGEMLSSVGRDAASGNTVAVYIGTAPVNLVRGWADADLVNAPVCLSSWAAVKRKMGYSAAWDKFTLCEAFNVHFNGDENIGPVVAINVLDPATHKAASETTAQITFVNGRATITSDVIILDSLVLEDKVEGTDYSLTYDFDKGQVVIESTGTTQITGTIAATYSTVDPSAVDAEDIIGGVTAGGVYTGLGSVSLIYQTHNLVPNLLAAPGWSDTKTVYDAMIAAATKINGHWNAMVVADIPVSENDTIAGAIAWKDANGYTSNRAKVCWPQVKTNAGAVYHLSTLWVWRQMIVDALHGGIPMETASNKAIPVAKQYFGASSVNRGFDILGGNTLNADGITTAVFFGGQWVLWGPHTAAFTQETHDEGDLDNRDIFDSNIRMMMYIINSFQLDWATTIDQPMTRALSETIKEREQEKADALAAVGALIGLPVVDFNESDNSTGELMQGNFVWRFEGTSPPPFKSGAIMVAYTADGYASYFAEEV